MNYKMIRGFYSRPTFNLFCGPVYRIVIRRIGWPVRDNVIRSVNHD